MATVEELEKIMEYGMSKARYMMLGIVPGVRIDCDSYQKRDSGILFLRNGKSSGFVSNEVFEKIEWEMPKETE